MQKEYLMKTRRLTDEKGCSWNLYYYLIEEESPQTEKRLYRLCIRKALPRQPEIAESVSTPPLAEAPAPARRLLQYLYRNMVTPICLLEVVDDLMNELTMRAS